MQEKVCQAWVIDFHASRSMVAGSEGHPQGGDEAADVAEASVQHPLLEAIDGEGRQITGKDVLAAVGDLLNDLLPEVPPDDPRRPALQSLAFVAGCRPRETRPRLAALRSSR